MTNSTIEYYNNNAQKYADSTLNVDMQSAYDKFAINIPEKSHILDVGCGSGRDSLYFIKKGYQVTAIDASSELANIATKNIGQEVKTLKVEDLKDKNKYDGVWCMASLLHLNKSELKTALITLSEALKPNGQFFASFKIGEGESLDSNNRFFSYTNAKEFKSFVDELKIFKNIKFTESGDSLGRGETQWLNVYAENDKPELKLKSKSKLRP